MGTSYVDLGTFVVSEVVSGCGLGVNVITAIHSGVPLHFTVSVLSEPTFWELGAMGEVAVAPG